MTPSDIEQAARRRYNSVNDTFWSQDEIFELIFGAMQECADECKAIERTYTATTVAGTQEYDFPTNAIDVKRVTYDGKKLVPITMREDDAVTGLGSSSTEQGTPQFYWTWNNTISLRPIPDNAKTLKIYTHDEPTTLTATSTIPLPTRFHMRLVNFVLSAMAAKDQNLKVADWYSARWKEDKALIRASVRKAKRADAFAAVQDEEQLNKAWIGPV